jgi:hypothetical protein
VRKGARIALAVATGLGLGLAALEVVLRCTGWVTEVANPLYSCHQNDPSLGWRGRAGLHVRFRRPEFDTLVVHDSAGWRVKDPPPPARPEHSVLFLGDSFVWGWGVSQGEVFTDRLQRAAPAVAVVNRGVNAFGTSQEWLLLQQELEAGSFERVALVLCANDFDDNTASKGGRRPLFELEGEELVSVNQPPRPLMSTSTRFLKDHCKAVSFVQFTFNALKQRLAGESPVEAGAAGPAAGRIPGEAVTVRLLREMRAGCERAGATFWIVPIVCQGAEGVGFGDARLPTLLQALERDDGFRVVSMLAAFERDAEAGKRLNYPGDGHWTPEGHATVARALLASELMAFPAERDPRAQPR